MRIHFIAIGGSAMHNLALALHYNHHTVSGSDDEIYNPARDRLATCGLLPKKMGWNAARITKDIDAIILGMHARKNNPELKRALALKIPIYSYPEYIYKQSRKKTRVVIAGSHGKTTTTAMIMHVLRFHKINFDYLVGAQLEGFDRMVRLTDSPVIIIEGDEYLSSPIDLKPKFLHYRPHLAVITGIAWDHINVFPTFENYCHQFELFIRSMPAKAQLFYFEGDPHLDKIIVSTSFKIRIFPYKHFNSILKRNKTHLIVNDKKTIPLEVFGVHNLQNMKAAYHVCEKLGVSDDQFFSAIQTFSGAAKRLQTLFKNKTTLAFQDFAHAPSKVKATTQAVKAQFPERKLIACLELHTFSSLNKNFLKEYKKSLDSADKAFVFFSQHTLEMKKLPPVSKKDIEKAFDHPNLKVFNQNSNMIAALNRFKWDHKNLLLMSSGTFNGLDMKKTAAQILNPE